MITAVILTKNEEKNIMECLHALDWCNQILIIDDYSEDNTIKLIEKTDSKKVTIFKHHLANNFAQQRNFALSKVKTDWVLFIDADERVSVSLQYEITSIINDSLENYAGYYIKRRDTIWGKELKHGESGQMKLLRLGKKNKGEWKGNVHEIWKLEGKIGELHNSLKHYPHQDITNFLSEINYYTTIRSQELFDKQTVVSYVTILIYPFAKFIQNFFIKRGFLDGLPGLVFAIFMSLHSFLVRGKLWLLWQKNAKQ